jgi:hypothetical protein
MECDETMSIHEATVHWRRLGTIVVATLVALCASAAATSSQPTTRVPNVAHRVRVAPTNDDQVWKAFAKFIHGVRANEGQAIKGLSRFDNATKNEDEATNRHIFDGLTGQPIVKVVRPRLAWDGNVAVISCLLVFDIRFKDGVRFTWKGRETFRLERSAASYVITSARITPAVLRFAHSPVAFTNSLSESDAASER